MPLCVSRELMARCHLALPLCQVKGCDNRPVKRSITGEYDSLCGFHCQLLRKRLQRRNQRLLARAQDQLLLMSQEHRHLVMANSLNMPINVNTVVNMPVSATATATATATANTMAMPMAGSQGLLFDHQVHQEEMQAIDNDLEELMQLLAQEAAQEQEQEQQQQQQQKQQGHGDSPANDTIKWMDNEDANDGMTPLEFLRQLDDNCAFSASTAMSTTTKNAQTTASDANSCNWQIDDDLNAIAGLGSLSSFPLDDDLSASVLEDFLCV